MILCADTHLSKCSFEQMLRPNRESVQGSSFRALLEAANVWKYLWNNGLQV